MRWATPEKVAVRKDFAFPSTTTRRLEREGGGAYWTVGLHVGRWIEKNCVLTAAQFAGKAFTLQRWQWRFLSELFEVVRDDGYEGGWRLKHRWCLLGLPKKNGKSELIGALALFFLLGTDEIDPRIFVAASTDEQANMVYSPVKYMAEQSKTVSPLVESKHRLIVSKTSRGGFIRRLAAVAGSNDGANVYVALIDEFHEWSGQKGEDVWNVITNGTVMREEPMVIHITTAGYDEDTICYQWYENGKAILDGTKEDDSYYFCWYEPDEDADYKDPETWRIANPSYGAIMKEAFYRDMLTKKTEAVYRRYFCNQWTEAEEIWDAAAKWDDLKGTPSHDFATRTYVGVDIGRKVDSTAVVVIQMHRDDAGELRAHVRQKIWSNPFRPGDSRRADWRLNTHEVDKYLLSLYDLYREPTGLTEDEHSRIAGPIFVYDPHLYGASADKLENDHGLNMVEFPQTDTQMVPASQMLFEWIMHERLIHDGNPEARSHVRAVIAKEKERGWRISKPTGSTKHVDFAVALAMALRTAVAHENVEEGDELQIW